MQIMLVLPPHSLEDRYGRGISKATGTLPPLGILYLAAYLKKDGHDVSVIDGSVESCRVLSDALKKKKPHVIGISVPTFHWQKAVKIIDAAKKEFPGTLIVAGGPHPTFCPRQCFVDAPLLDAVVMGEGEITLLEVCRAFSSGRTFDGIAGLAFRTGDGGIKVNEPRQPIVELDKVPFPARELIDLYRYKPAIEQYRKTPVTNIISSRGCPSRCIFCMHVVGEAIRYRSPQGIIDEIEFLLRNHGIKEIDFWDDTITVDRNRIFEMCRLMRQKNLDIIWSAQARVDTVDTQMLKEMKSAGCWKLFFGIESLLQKNLDALKKGTTVEQALDAVKRTKQAGIEVEASFIFGIPGETYEEAREDAFRIIRLNPDYIKCFPLTPLPGTELYVNVGKYGKLLTENLDDFTENKVVFVPYAMTERQLMELIPSTYKRFYLRPSYILGYISKMRSFEDLERGIRGAMAMVGL